MFETPMMMWYRVNRMISKKKEPSDNDVKRWFKGCLDNITKSRELYLELRESIDVSQDQEKKKTLEEMYKLEKRDPVIRLVFGDLF